MATETFGSSISPTVVSQLNQRASILESNTKDVEKHVIINSNTAFIKLRSGVDLITNKSTSPTADTAKSFILFGGTSYAGQDKPRQGVDMTPNNSVVGTTAAYNNYRSTGFRPMPGITGFDIQTYNTFGTLRLANISFTLWDVKDLEIAEKLYFKPGYSVIVEWGHTVYVDNNGNKKTAGIDSNTLSDDFVFSTNFIETVEDKIQEKRNNCSGNYDGFFGYVLNFNYTFRPDGGYDCTIRVASKGVILDSLRSGDASDAGEYDTDTNADADAQKNRSIFHLILKSLEEYQKEDQPEFDGFSYILNEIRNPIKFKGDYKLQPFSAFYSRVEIDDSTWYTIDKDVNLIYVPLRVVLDIFNKFGSIYLEDDKKREHPITGFSIDYGEKYVTFPEHYSINPLVVLLPKSTQFNGTTFSLTTSNINTLFNQYAKQNEGGDNDILNLMVPTAAITSVLDPLVSSERNDLSILDFFRNLLSNINKSLSNICRLDIFYDEGINRFKIVDRNNPQQGKDLQTINLTGLKSTLKTLNISSRISSEISAQVAIAAQGDATTYKDNVSTILNWNEGAVDRFVRTKVTKTFDKDKNIDKEEKLFNRIVKFWQEFNEGTFLSEEQSNLQTEMIKHNTINYQNYISDKLEKGVIPVTLSFTLKGISGLKIGQAFKINKNLLPSKYDSWAYIITGLEQNIDSDNQWYTTVTTQFFKNKKS